MIMYLYIWQRHNWTIVSNRPGRRDHPGFCGIFRFFRMSWQQDVLQNPRTVRRIQSMNDLRVRKPQINRQDNIFQTAGLYSFEFHQDQRHDSQFCACHDGQISKQQNPINNYISSFWDMISKSETIWNLSHGSSKTQSGHAVYHYL